MDKKITTIEIKKLFSKHSRINFLNDYTLQDLEDAKKRCYIHMIKEHPQQADHLQTTLDSYSKQMMEEKFMLGSEKSVGTVVKNTVRDTLNPDYKNTVKRLINLDSQYRPFMQFNIDSCSSTVTNECGFLCNLTEKLVNVVSIQLENIQIPYTFYNIETAQGNNYFYITINTTQTKIILPDGHYTLSSLIIQINLHIKLIEDAKIIFDIDNITAGGTLGVTTGKTNITNNIVNPTTLDCIITFYESNQLFNEPYTKYNNNVGWILGFRNFVKIDNEISLSYIIPNSSTILSESVACVNDTKYIMIVVDEFAKNTTSGTLIQMILDTTYIKPTTYWQYQDKTKCLSDISCSNMTDYLDPSRTLTKAQLYSQAQINHNKVNINYQSLRLDCVTPNNVLGIVPFDMHHEWGLNFFTDKIDYKREYHGPIEIDKLQIQLYNDKGIPMNFNGNDWYMTISSEQLYKY